MKKLYILLVVILIWKLGSSQIIYQENFQGGLMPSTFTLYNDTLIPADTAFLNQAWIVRQFDNEDTNNYVAATSSWFTNGPIKADRWMITPAIIIPTGSSLNLSWRSMNIDPNAEDSLKVLISKTGNLKSDFTDTLFVGADTNIWTNHLKSLSLFAGDTIYVAFVDQSNDKYILLVDDIQVGNFSGINQLVTYKIEVNVYPNPAINFINIKANELIKEIRVFNSIGQLIISDEIKSKYTTLNTSGLRQGLYTVSITTEKGINVQKICITK